MIGIIAAMDEERDAFLSSGNWKSEKRNNVLFYRGTIGGKDVVLTK